MISIGNKKNLLRCSQPSMKPITNIVNENGPSLKTKAGLQNLLNSKRPGILGGNIPRAFGRNIGNLPLIKKPRNESRLKQDLKEEVSRMRKPLTIQTNPQLVNVPPIVIEEHSIAPIQMQDAPKVQTFEPKLEPKIETAQPEPMIIDNPISVREEPKYTNPQMCEEYIGEIDVYLRNIEGKFCANPNYMSSQSDINEKMRAILVDWLVDVHIRFKLMPETLFLTINLIDRYLEKERVSRDKLQLLGVTCMLISSKYEEIYPPEVKDFAYITDNAYTKDEILMMEQKILRILEFNLNVPSSYRFLLRFSNQLKTDAKTLNLARYFIELSLTEMEMLKFLPSIIAGSALYSALKIQNKENQWGTIIPEISKEKIQECTNDMLALFNAAGKGSLQAIKKKFSGTQYMEVAKFKLN